MENFERKLAALLSAAALLALAAVSHAGAGFISSSRVDTGTLYTDVTIRFRCKVQYVGHEPAGKSDVLRVRLEATTVCPGATPGIADTRELHRPLGADDANVESIEYDGETGGDRVLRVNFGDDVAYLVDAAPGGDGIRVRVLAAPKVAAATPSPASKAMPSRQVRQAETTAASFVINLQSWQRPVAAADIPAVDIEPGRQLFVSEAEIDGRRWYRVRLGYFASSAAADDRLNELRAEFPGAWIDRVTTTQAESVPRLDTSAPSSNAVATKRPATPAADDDKVAELMAEARRAMTAGEGSRAVQIYTKVLQMPPHASHADAQEYLALARERNGQVAHAKAEYQRYLDIYPEGEGADRVRQRLAALLAGAGQRASANSGTGTASLDRQPATRRKPSDWKIRTFWSQFYRRDVNQVNDQDEIVSQSSIYTDANLDARRRGSRFDFSSRISLGYRTDLLGSGEGGAGNDLRLSYAYADLADSKTGLRGRLGRQTRSTGGVLGRFDGLNLGYAVNEQLRLDAVAGRPVFSTSDSVDDLRTFYGLSATFGPVIENLDVGVFVLKQSIDGMTDRQVVGGELRYFGENRTVWGLIDYDTEFEEFGSGFLQASWRLPGSFTVTGLIDRRRSPYLTLGNALIGQLDQEFRNLATALTEEELRDLALDRSAPTTTVTLGLSKPLTPRLQLGLNVTESRLEATPESGGVPGNPAADYRYYSVDLVASSLFREGDVGIASLRHSRSSTTDIDSLHLDARFPIGRAWRINPRLRVDYRTIRTDMSEEWIYTPGLRMQYRPSRKLRIDLEAGRQFSTREMEAADLDRESYFVNLGYQYFF